MRGDIRWEQGQRENAVDDWLRGMRLTEVPDGEVDNMQNAFRDGGVVKFLEATIAWMKRQQAAGEHGLNLNLAIEEARLGQRSEALASLELAVDDRIPALWANVCPAFRDLRNEPRFQTVLQRLGIPQH